MLSGTWAPGLDRWYRYTLGEHWGRGWGWMPGPSFSIDKESELGPQGELELGEAVFGPLELVSDNWKRKSRLLG